MKIAVLKVLVGNVMALWLQGSFVDTRLADLSGLLARHPSACAVLRL